MDKTRSAETDSEENGLLRRLRKRSPTLAIALRDFTSLRREKTIVLALLVQIIVASFSSFLVVGLVSVYSDDSTADTRHSVTIINEADDNVIGQALRAESAFIDRGIQSREEATTLIKESELDGAILIQETDDGVYDVTVYAPDGALQTTVLISDVKGVLESVERDTRVQRAGDIGFVEYPGEESVPNPYFSFTYTVLLPLLVFLPVFLSGGIVVDTITEEVESGTLELLRAAPVSVRDILSAKLLVAILLAPSQVLLWLGLLLLNDIPIYQPGALLVYVLAATLLFVALGASTALRFPERRQAQLIYSVGLVGIFSVASILPESPPNTIARLAVGSATTQTYAVAGGTLVVGVLVYIALDYVVIPRMKLLGIE